MVGRFKYFKKFNQRRSVGPSAEGSPEKLRTK